jgi:nitroreductase
MQNITDIEQGPISAETICELVGEAMNIQSVALGQPTQFIVLNEIESLSKASEIVPHHPFAKQALAAIVVCGDLDGAEDKEKWMFDCETASQKLLLAAHASGFGAHISTIYPDKEKIYNMTTLLNLPDNIIAHTYVSMGSPAEITSSCEAFNNGRVHFNGWVIK